MANMKGVRDQLRRLDVLGDRLVGATEDELDELSHQLGWPLPEALVALWRHVGIRSGLPRMQRGSLIRRWADIVQNSIDVAERTGIGGVVAFGEDGSGDVYLLDGGGAHQYWDHEDPARLVPLGPFEDWLEQLVDAALTHSRSDVPLQAYSVGVDGLEDEAVLLQILESAGLGHHEAIPWRDEHTSPPDGPLSPIGTSWAATLAHGSHGLELYKCSWIARDPRFQRPTTYAVTLRGNPRTREVEQMVAALVEKFRSHGFDPRVVDYGV